MGGVRRLVLDLASHSEQAATPDVVNELQQHLVSI